MKFNPFSFSFLSYFHSYRGIAGTVFFLYLIPVIVLCFYSQGMMPPSYSWSIFTNGLTVSIIGSFLIFWLLVRWQKNLKPTTSFLDKPLALDPELPIPVLNIAEKSVESEELIKLRESHLQLTHEVDSKETELQYLYGQIEEFQMKVQHLNEELENERQHVHQTLQQQDLPIKKYQTSLLEQDIHIKKQQEEIFNLEDKCRELSYEIKTLLALNK